MSASVSINLAPMKHLNHDGDDQYLIPMHLVNFLGTMTSASKRG